MLDFLKRLRQVKIDDENKSSGKWRTLVVSVVDEKPLAEREVLRLLEELGKSLEDLDAAVAAVKVRRRKREAILQADAAAVEQSKCERKLEQASAKFEPIQKQYDETVDQLSAEIQNYQHVQMRARDNRDELARSCMDADLLASVEAAREAERQAQQRLQDALNGRSEASRYHQMISASLSVVDQNSEDAAAYRKQLERASVKCDEAIAAVEAAQLEVRTAQQAIRTIESKMAESEL